MWRWGLPFWPLLFASKSDLSFSRRASLESWDKSFCFFTILCILRFAEFDDYFCKDGKWELLSPICPWQEPGPKRNLIFSFLNTFTIEAEWEWAKRNLSFFLFRKKKSMGKRRWNSKICLKILFSCKLNRKLERAVERMSKSWDIWKS